MLFGRSGCILIGLNAVQTGAFPIIHEGAKTLPRGGKLREGSLQCRVNGSPHKDHDKPSTIKMCVKCQSAVEV